MKKYNIYWLLALFFFIILVIFVYKEVQHIKIQNAKQELIEENERLIEPSAIEKLQQEYRITKNLSKKLEFELEEKKKEYEASIWKSRCLSKKIEVEIKRQEEEINCSDDLEKWAGYNLGLLQ